MIRFQPGETVLLRSFRHSDRSLLSLARPSRVLFDDERGLMTWTGAGWLHIRQRAADGSAPRLLAEQRGVEWEMAEVEWASGVLTLMPPGRTHALWWFFDSDGGFADWYVNLEERQVRWRTDGGAIGGGVDTADDTLDLIGSRGPTGNTVKWKDEDEFAERIGHPWYWDEAGASAIRAGDFPFDGSFCDFRPDPAWTAPADLSAAWLPRAGD